MSQEPEAAAAFHSRGEERGSRAPEGRAGERKISGSSADPSSPVEELWMQPGLEAQPGQRRREVAL